jgi:hypothetical protein
MPPAGDRPERIRRTTVDLRRDWEHWIGSLPEEILRPEMSCEGIAEPLERPTGGASHLPVAG